MLLTESLYLYIVNINVFVAGARFLYVFVTHVVAFD